MDTRSGERTRLAVLALSFLIVCIQLMRMIAAALVVPPSSDAAQAVYWWVVQLVIAIVAAAISYATRPKQPPLQPQAGNAPTVEDGLSAKHHFGTCWVDDKFWLAWKMTGTEPIRTKGGKK
ncbi:hypothetical protein [Lysobacter enzymogenes]|uniref:hypothetical protein n=1 Tax=Lysobacter enzymogenes TaxID=69 RepID=UPI001F515D23|nr:hypothetical protein [Lysobacter enzymogenes]UZW62768.1 hypothetical protein BV903_010940 [Lysobacter enzymogenes]